MGEMQILNLHIQGMRILALIAFAYNDVPELHVFQRLHDRLIIALFQWVGVEADGAWKEVGVLREANEARADGLARNPMEWKGID